MRWFRNGTFVPSILLVGAALAAPARAEVTLIGTASIPGDATDKSGLTGTLSEGTPHNRLGSMGSGIAYTGVGPRYLLIADRGPADGVAEYRCRMHTFDIAVKPGSSPVVQPRLLGTTLLTDEAGHSFVGLASAIDTDHPARSLRLDPEGVRVARSGTVFVSDEYGPFIYEFDREGKRLRSLPVPDKFLVKHPHADPRKEAAANPTGRLPNRGLEGLAISPDGGKLYAILQSALTQDGGFDGLNVRILELDIQTGATREFIYALDDKKYGINEILAVNAHEFLVIERDTKPGALAKFKKIMKIDLTGATDVSDVPTLPKKGIPAGVVPVKKRVFIDLLDRKFGLTDDKLPAKIEGLAFGPDLPGGRHLLLVTSDNDFIKDQPTWFYAFAIDRKDLPDFQQQTFTRP